MSNNNRIIVRQTDEGYTFATPSLGVFSYSTIEELESFMKRNKTKYTLIPQKK